MTRPTMWSLPLLALDGNGPPLTTAPSCTGWSRRRSNGPPASSSLVAGHGVGDDEVMPWRRWGEKTRERRNPSRLGEGEESLYGPRGASWSRKIVATLIGRLRNDRTGVTSGGRREGRQLGSCGAKRRRRWATREGGSPLRRQIERRQFPGIFF